MFAASLVAFVSARLFPAIGACAFHEPVREEAFIMGAVSKPDHLGVNISFVNKGFNDTGRSRMVRGRVCIPEDTELNFHSLEDILKMIMIFFDQFTGCDLEFFCIYHNGRSMGVGAADERCILPLFAEGTDKDVSRYVGTKVPDMALAIGIRKAAGYKNRLVGWKVGHGILTWKSRYKIHFSDLTKSFIQTVKY